MMFQKKFMRCAAAAFSLLAAGAAFVLLLPQKTEDIQTANLFVMDTACSISMIGGSPQPVIQRLQALDKVLDCYDEESDLYHLNHGGELAVSQEASDFLLKAAQIQRQYSGQVDITAGALTMLWGITTDHPAVPDEAALAKARQTIGLEHLHQTPEQTLRLDDGTMVDGGAFAKGYALDEVARVLEKQAAACANVSMTSSILLYGQKPDDSLFTVAVRDPNGDGLLGTIQTGACFVSTSGGYERFFTAEDGTTYGHILNPETGLPVETDLTTVTVLCDSGLLSDYLSTLIYMGGTAALEPHLHASDYAVVAADEQGRLYVSDGLAFEPATAPAA